MMKKAIDGWMLRHQDRTSFVLHMIGIPMTIAAVVLLIVCMLTAATVWLWPAVVLFVVGYALQFVGHAFEGNDAGELILIKKLLGRPYVDVASQYRSDDGEQEEARSEERG